jgi:hypothetical protein
MYNIVFLMMNVRCSKHVADKKNWIKNITLKGAFGWLTINIVSQCTVQKTKYFTSTNRKHQFVITVNRSKLYLHYTQRWSYREIRQINICSSQDISEPASSLLSTTHLNLLSLCLFHTSSSLINVRINV